jgi:aryl-alcohol dehydrogenase-like predicted oxidoreductase
MSLKPGQPENENILRAALEKGINYFDTADLYDKGANEITVGNAFKGMRDKVILATKVGNQWRPDGSGWDWNPSKVHILESVDKSLKRLQTDYIDLYQLHGGTVDDPFNETLEAFEQLVKQGKVRFYGISSIRPNVIRNWIEKSSIISVMMQYSMLDQRPEESIIPLLQEKEIGLLVRGAIAQGLLVDKQPVSYLEHTEDEVMQAKNAVHQASGTLRSPAQTALRFVSNNPAVTSVIAGIRTMEQLNENIDVLNSPELTIKEMELLRKSAEKRFYTQHR